MRAEENYKDSAPCKSNVGILTYWRLLRYLYGASVQKRAVLSTWFEDIVLYRRSQPV